MTRGLVVLMYILPAALVAAGIFLPTALLTLLSAPLAVSLWKIFSAPKPKTPPAWAIGWPLYFVGIAFIHNRRFGMLYLLGILLDIAAHALWPGLQLPKLF